MRRQFLAILAVLTTLLVAACGARREDPQVPGITNDTIVIGSSVPRSGPASAYALTSAGLQAWFAKVNAEGGVKMGDGKTRKIEYVSYDDAYAPEKVIANVRRLVTDDEVFAVAGIIGTPTNLAVRDYLNSAKVPQVFSDSPSSLWGDVENFPYTRGWQPTYGAEANIYASYLKEEMPAAKVAILSQNDDYGDEMAESFTAALEGSDVEVVAHETYEVSDPSVATQVTKLSESGADVFLDIATSKAAAQAIRKQAELGWNATHIVNRISSSILAVLEPAGLDNARGLLSAAFYKDPSSPAWESDPAMAEYREAADAAGFDSDDLLGLSGWVMGQVFTHALERTEEPTRESLLAALDAFDGFTTDLMLPGVTATSSADDHFLIESMYLIQFDGKDWNPVGDVISAEGSAEVFK